MHEKDVTEVERDISFDAFAGVIDGAYYDMFLLYIGKRLFEVHSTQLAYKLK